MVRVESADRELRGPDFGEVRSLMQRTPDEDSWEQLCALVELWPRDLLEAEVMPYLERHLSRWADVHRMMPWPWVERMMRGQHIPALGLVKTLDLRSRRLRPDQLDRIFVGDWTDALTQLYMSSAALTADELIKLAQHGRWSKLEVLSLDQNTLGSQGPKPLHACAWPALRELYLESCYMGAAGLSAALDGPWASTLKVLDASNFIMGPGRLPKTLPVEGLERLYLNWVRPSAPAWATIVSWPWRSLKTLSLEGHELDLLALRTLLGSPMAASLEQLCLNWNQLGPEGAKALAQAEHLMGLQGLDLRRNSIGDEGAQALMRAPWFGALKVLRLGHNRLSAPLKAQLAAYPFVEL